MLPAMLACLAAGMALLVSPDHLRLWGNMAGHIGPGFWIAAIGVAAVFAPTGASYRRLALSRAGAGGYLAALKVQGGLTAVALALTSRLALTIGLSTGILVTSGFVFNETFVYWFPNFAFAFILLALVALVFCRGYGLAEKILTALLATTLLGLVALVLAGVLQMDPEALQDAAPASGCGTGAAFTGLLLFAGFDLGIHRGARARDTVASTRMMPVVLGISLVLLSLWGAASLAHVPANRLADSFIPYTLAARQIGGQTGRILVGVVVIAGTGCAVISLFSATARMISSLARLDMLPRFCGGSAQRNVLATSVLALAIAAMMAAGVAGAPELEVFIRAAFLLWLLHVVLVHLAAFNTHGPNASTGLHAWSRHLRWLFVTAAILLAAGAVYLWVTDNHRVPLLKYMMAVWSGGALVLFLARLAKKHKRRPSVL
jgi:amino acid transporter